MELICFEHVYKTYGQGEGEVHALDDVSFSVKEGEFCVLLGASGAGKTTLLNLLGGMDRASAGTILFGAPGGRTFYRVKVPTLPGSGKGIAERQGCPSRGGI